MQLKPKIATPAPEPPNKGGRPREPHDYDDLFAELERLPDDPLEIAVFCQRLLAKAMILTLQGRGNRERNQELRGFVNSINRIIPKERLLRAEKTILGATGARKASAVHKGPLPTPRAIKPTTTIRR